MSSRFRRTKAEIAAGLTKEQAQAARGGNTPVPYMNGMPVSREEVLAELGLPKTWEAEKAELMVKFHAKPLSKLKERLRASGYDGGYLPAEFAAMFLDYVDGSVNKEEFEADFPEIFS